MASVFLLVPALTFAQSGIAGIVRDTTGAVLPGVTVEAASPALIEKVRSAVTDGEGRYTIVDLRPGFYSVTFTLPGFSVFKREGIELPASFTATVNAEMRVGAIEETVSVTGAAPTVDVRSVTQQVVLSKTVLDSLPVGRSPHNFAALTPGVTSVNLGDFSTGRTANSVAVHGSRTSEATVSVDGDRINLAMAAGGANVTTRLNPAMVGEMTLTTTGGSAEFQGAGVQTNIIPREGGNSFSGYLFTQFSYDGFQASNLTDKLRAQDVGESGIVKLWDVDPAIGGRIIRDRLWLYGSVRNSAIIHTRPGIFEDITQTDWAYTPDRSRPARSHIQDDDYSIRLTWQASEKDKFNFAATAQPRVHFQHGYENLGWTTEATSHYTYYPNLILQAVWKRAATNRLLLEAGTNLYDTLLKAQPQRGFDSTLISATEETTGVVFRNNPIGSSSTWGYHDSAVWNYRASLSYVTGSHTFKVGGNHRHTDYTNTRYTNGEYNVSLRNGVPFRLTLAAPWIYTAHIKADVSLYAQDSWTVKRLTLNAGLRYDYFNGWNEADDLPAGRFAPARSFPGTTRTPVWHDVSERFGAAIDVFGNTRTAVKLSLGRYVNSAGATQVTAYNPVNRSALTATRTWNDGNKDFIPDCDFTNPNPNGECGRLSDLNFGTSNPRAATTDDNVTHGFAVRPYNWEASAAVQHELIRGLSVTAGYYWRRYGNFTVTENTLVGPADYDPYCITAPVDPRLPGGAPSAAAAPGTPSGGGYQVCGLYEIKQEKFGQTQNNISRAERFGKQTEVYNGVDLTTNARFANGMTWSGGLNVGRTVTNRCFVVDSPQELRFCEVKPPFQPNFKMFALFPLRWGVEGTVVYQTIPGPELQASYLATNQEIAASLGRNLSAGAGGTVRVPLIEPGTMFGDYQQTVDLRFTRTFHVGRYRLLAGVDVNNVLNAAGVWNVNTNYGPEWLKPNQIMVGRYFGLTGQLTF